MSQKLNLSGMRFGKLIAVEPKGSNLQGNEMWLCKCDCGSETIVNSQYLKSGKTKSCGCYRADAAIKRNKERAQYPDKTHSKYYRLYRIYWGMKTRCYNKNEPHYKRYGARGISICIQSLQTADSERPHGRPSGQDGRVPCGGQADY